MCSTCPRRPPRRACQRSHAGGPLPTEDHQDISSLLWAWLRAHAPRDFKAVLAVGVAVSVDHTYEPDVILRRAGGDGSRHFFPADPGPPHGRGRVAAYAGTGTDSASRPSTRPQVSRATGESSKIRSMFHAYRLAPKGGYELVTDSAGRLEARRAVRDLGCRSRRSPHSGGHSMWLWEDPERRDLRTGRRHLVVPQRVAHHLGERRTGHRAAGAGRGVREDRDDVPRRVGRAPSR